MRKYAQNCMFTAKSAQIPQWYVSKTSDWYLRMTNVLLFADFTVAILCNIVFFKVSKMEILLKNPKTMLAWTHLLPRHSAVFVLRASSTVAQLS